MDPLDPFAASIPAPTAARPLLGLTLLVVEDSRFTCDAIRLVCLKSGARIRRADCLRSARRHLRVYRPSVVVVDLGLPDGSGLDLVADLTGPGRCIDAVLAMSGEDALERAALHAGADGFISKPITSVAAFQEAVLSLLPPERRPSGPRVITDELVHPDPLAYQDDIAHIAELLDDQGDGPALDYAAQFLCGVARSADDLPLARAAEALALKRAAGGSAGSEVAVLAGMVQTRLSQQIAI